MTLPAPTVRVYFGLRVTGDTFFTLNDPVKGLLDSAYTLAGDIGSELDGAFAVSIARGRSRWLDDNQAGTCTVSLRNQDRRYDPLLNEDADLVDDDGDIVIDENGDLLNSPTSPYAGVMLPGKKVEVEIYGVMIFAGRAEEWGVAYTPNGTTAAALTANDALSELARREFDEWTTTAGQLAGARLTAILNRSEVAFPANRDLDDGQSTLQGDLVTWGSNVLNYAQLVAKSDLGNLFVDRRGVLTFRDRHARMAGAVQATFADDGTGISFSGAQIESGSVLLFNRVGVDREGGILQTSEDATSQDEYGIRSLNDSSGLLMDDDAQAKNMADYMLGLFKDPKERVSSVTVSVSKLTDGERATVCGLDLDDAIAVAFTPLGIGDQVSQRLYIEGIEHDISVDGTHDVTFYTSRADSAAPFTLDDPLLGLLNGAGVLTY